MPRAIRWPTVKASFPARANSDNMHALSVVWVTWWGSASPPRRFHCLGFRHCVYRQKRPKLRHRELRNVCFTLPFIKSLRTYIALGLAAAGTFVRTCASDCRRFSSLSHTSNTFTYSYTNNRTLLCAMVLSNVADNHAIHTRLSRSDL